MTRATLLVGVVAGLGAIQQGRSVSEPAGEDLVTVVAVLPLEAAVTLVAAAALATVGDTYGYAAPYTFIVRRSLAPSRFGVSGFVLEQRPRRHQSPNDRDETVVEPPAEHALFVLSTVGRRFGERTDQYRFAVDQ